ncbi:MAG: isochorismate synthase [Candidatus Hydrogenedentes bacterium]|nr:isochorismate synthase [Candidatus Hydrogenedentota bacterium]
MNVTPVYSIENALAALASKVKTALKTTAPAVMLQRIEIQVDGAVEPIDWLAAQDPSAQYYWSDRAGEFSMAGIGEADVVIPSGPVDYAGLFSWLRQRLPDSMPSLRYYGGFRFDTGPASGNRWSTFKSFRFIVPRLEVLRRGNSTVVACNIKVGPARQNDHEWESVQDTLQAVVPLKHARKSPLPKVISRKDMPNQQTWEATVEAALDAFRAGSLEKVVLARETTFRGDAAWPPVAVLQQLMGQTRRSFDFCFRPSPDRAFIGASPERLYKRMNCFLQSEALAGTRARGRTNEEDRRLAEELMSNDKERREHQFVVKMLEEQCGRFCAHVAVAEKPKIMRLLNVQHLLTTLEGVLNNNEVDAELLQALHPTPAVGGVPREEALKWLAEHEPFDRGIYAAPVGWVGYDGAEFCVAIRSALIQGNDLCVYTGAGIVPGSVAAEEWQEIEHKMSVFRHALH